MIDHARCRLHCRANGLLLLAALLVLVGCGTVQSSSLAPKTTPVPTIDPVLQAYAVAVHRYYQPFSDAVNNEDDTCRLVRPTPWTICQSATRAALAAGQDLLAHLPSTPPPAQLQAMDTALLQAVRAVLSAYQKRAPAVAAHDSAAFDAGNSVIDQVINMQCDPLTQFNAVAPSGTHIEAPHGQCPI
jgi:hypothetical protein